MKNVTIKNNVIFKYNIILESNNQKIRILSYCDTLNLSTGVILYNHKDILNFYNRCVSNTYKNYIGYIYDDIEYIYDRLSEIRKCVLSEAGKKAQKIHGEKIKSNLNVGIPWNKGLTKETDDRIPLCWNKGLTKETDDRLLNLSVSRFGIGNPMFGYKHTPEYKRTKSELMKFKIKNNLFTPNIHNSKTHWQILYNDKKYRSSWEAVFHHLNPICEYETLRILYNIDDVTKVYIVDFVDHTNKIVYEIKPLTYKHDVVVKAKEYYAILWCDGNGYKYVNIHEDYFVDNYNLIDFSVFDKKIKDKMDKLCMLKV